MVFFVSCFFFYNSMNGFDDDFWGYMVGDICCLGFVMGGRSNDLLQEKDWSDPSHSSSL